MSYLLILGKGLLSIVALFFFTKLMGNKQASQLTLFDYIIGISIGSIAAAMTIDEQVDFIEGIIGIALYALVALLISVLTSKSIIARRFFTGVPIILIQDGKVLYNNLKRSKLDINDLLQVARVNGYFDLSKIEYALMEPNGNVSFLLKSKNQPVIRSDLKIKCDYEGLCANLIIDGNIMYNNLSKVNKKVDWLIKRLENNGYKDLDKLLLVTLDSKEQLHIYEKDIDILDYSVLL